MRSTKATRAVTKVRPQGGPTAMADCSTHMRRAAAGLACTFGLLVLPATAIAADSPPPRDPLALLGRTAIAALGSAGADTALQRVTDNLALLAAQERIAEEA